MADMEDLEAVGDMEVVVTASEVSRAEAAAVAATETGTEAATAMEGSRAEAAREEATAAWEEAETGWDSGADTRPPSGAEVEAASMEVS